MSFFVSFHSCSGLNTLCIDTICNLHEVIFNTVGLSLNDYFVICNGKLVSEDSVSQKGHVYHVIPRVLGGKGGFGSMLRAIGAQIEKTTSREACRDLSGRRMRDVNNEKKLKEWIGKQADREQEREEKRKERMAKRRARVQHNFDDPTYADQRGKVSANLEDALQKGLRKAQSKPEPSSTVTSEMMASEMTVRKRKTDPGCAVKSKKSRVWLGIDLDELGSDDSTEENDQSPSEDSKTIENDALQPGVEKLSREPVTEFQEDSKTFEEKKTGLSNAKNSETVASCLSVDDIKTEKTGLSNAKNSETVGSCLGVDDIKTEKTGLSNAKNSETVAFCLSVDDIKTEKTGLSNAKNSETVAFCLSVDDIKTEKTGLSNAKNSETVASWLGVDDIKTEKTGLSNAKNSETVASCLGVDDIKTEKTGLSNAKNSETVASCLGVDDIKTEKTGLSNAKNSETVASCLSVDDIKTENSGSPITSRTASQKTETDSNVGCSEKNKVSTESRDHPVLAAQSPPVHVKQEAETGKIESTKIKNEPVDLLLFNSSSELEALGLDHLKAELMRRALKCGGTLQQRAERLFSVKGLEQNQIDPSLFSKPQKGKKKK